MATIRLVDEADAGQIRRIYAPFCADDSPVSFEVEVPTLDEIKRRIARTLERHPWIACDEGGEILGYVYGTTHRERAAYRWSVDVSAYVADGHRGSGIGRALYTSLFALLRLQGYVNAYAGIALPNAASVGLHRSMGFEPVGVYRQVGFKCGAWHDVGWWQRPMVERPDRPDSPIGLVEARTLPSWDLALESGLPFLRLVGN